MFTATALRSPKEVQATPCLSGTNAHIENILLFLITALLHFSCSRQHRQQVPEHQECITSEKPTCLEMNKAEIPEVMGKDDAFKLSPTVVFLT